jgi:hypothetical protein
VRPLILILLLAAPVVARQPPAPPPTPAPDPVAKLSGPKAVDLGAPIILNPTGSTAPGGYEFGVAAGPGPVPIVTLKSDDKQTVIGMATAATPGSYQFYVVAWGQGAAAAGVSPHAFAFWTVTVGQPAPPPPPTPPPPGPSDGAMGLVKASRDGMAGVQLDAMLKANTAKALADAQQKTAATLTTSPQPTDPAQLAVAALNLRRTNNGTAAGANAAAWVPWAVACDAQVQALYAAGRLKTVADWSAALTEIAQGLTGG